MQDDERWIKIFTESLNGNLMTLTNFWTIVQNDLDNIGALYFSIIFKPNEINCAQEKYHKIKLISDDKFYFRDSTSIACKDCYK